MTDADDKALQEAVVRIAQAALSEWSRIGLREPGDPTQVDTYALLSAASIMIATAARVSRRPITQALDIVRKHSCTYFDQSSLVTGTLPALAALLGDVMIVSVGNSGGTRGPAD